MEFRNANAMDEFKLFLEALKLKGYELKAGENGFPLTKHNDRLLTSYLHANHTGDDNLTEATQAIFWKWLTQDQYKLEWNPDKIPAGVAKKQGIVVRPKGQLPTYKDPAEAVKEKESLERQYKGWQACIQIMKSTHANHSIINRRRQAEIKALIDDGQKDPSKPELCLAKIRKLQQSWGD